MISEHNPVFKQMKECGHTYPIKVVKPAKSLKDHANKALDKIKDKLNANTDKK